jgi:hypothetical protein
VVLGALLVDIVGVRYYLDVTPEAYYKLALREFIFFYVIVFGYSLVKVNGYVSYNYVLKIDENEHKFLLLFKISILYVIMYVLYVLFNRMDYEVNNDMSSQEGGVFQILNFISIFTISFLWIIIINNQNKKLKNISALLILATAIVNILSGSRIYLLSVLFLSYFYFRDNQSKIKLIRNYVLIVVLTLFSLLLLPILATQRVGSNDYVSLNLNSIFKTNELIFEELNTKLNSVVYSTVLLKYDGGNFAGFNPYKGSLTKFIPRFIWPTKPTPTSYNSSVDGIPSRRIPDLIDQFSDTYNTGTSPYAVSFWQLGLYGVLISFFLNIIFLTIISTFLKNTHVIVQSFGFLLIGFPQLNLLPASGDNIVVKLEELLVYVSVFFILRYVKFTRNYESFNL